MFFPHYYKHQAVYFIYPLFYITFLNTIFPREQNEEIVGFWRYTKMRAIGMIGVTEWLNIGNKLPLYNLVVLKLRYMELA